MPFHRNDLITITLAVTSLVTCCTCAGQLSDTSDRLISYPFSYPNHHYLSNDLQINQRTDAPKYYDLNALLYKSTNNKHRGTADLRPLDGEPISSPRRAQTNVDDEESSIDSLIRNMQRNKANTDSLDDINATNEGISKTSLGGDGNSRRPMNNGIGPDDEATIQRKSTNVEDEQSPTSSSRLRASKGKCGVYYSQTKLFKANKQTLMN